MLKEKLSFHVDVKGERSEQRFEGAFVIKTKLSWREIAKEDEVRRQVLGFNSGEASPLAAMAAQQAAYLAVRLVDAPKWWGASNNGLDLEDLNVLAEVYKKAADVVEAEYKRLADEADKAKDALKKDAEKA